MAAVGWKARARDLIDLTRHRPEVPAVEPLDVIDLRSVASEPLRVVTPRPTGVIAGGGAINSALGGFSRVPSAAGEATFGFHCSRLDDAAAPTGFTALTFERCGLEFQSSAYDWLVVAGSTATAMGSGRVDGVEGFTFELTATDADGVGRSRFRLKIWISATGGVIYDSMPRTRTAKPSPITRGTITVLAV